MISTTAPSFTAPRPAYLNSFDDSNKSAGRIRFPPPPRRYSPISVIAVTFETVSRPNSRSMAARSSRRSSKTSRPLVAGIVLIYFSPRRHGGTEKINLNKTFSAPAVSTRTRTNLVLPSVSPCLRGELVCPVIRKLHINSEILLLQQSDDFLQRVAILPADPHEVSLD